MSRLKVTRRPERFRSNDKKVITRFFGSGELRSRAVIQRVLQLDEPEVVQLLNQVLSDFSSRHRHLEAAFEINFDQVKSHVGNGRALSHNRRLLIGAYFTMEYSVESAALFNPSIVLHPNQSGLGEGQARFLMSLRATGEGHVSSIVFRTGKVFSNGHIEFDPPSRFAAPLRVCRHRQYEKKLFFLKLIEMAAYNDTARIVLDELPDFFTYDELEHKINETRQRPGRPRPFSETAENMLWLAQSNYHLELPPETDPSEVLIFPTSENESKGLEDLRLTRFVDEEDNATYYGTYTAYNGFRSLPQLLQTHDFTNIQIHTLNGKYVQNKGMALFPRQIDGYYHMISRLDGENMYLMRSDNVHFWNDCQKLQAPNYPWEFVQIGNSGAPLETDAGWLLLTHGVGPMRQYCIGASLLDLDNPQQVLATLNEPLLAPQEDERDGYVPNVVYSCGAMVHNDLLILPYAISDTATTFATVSITELLNHLN